MSHRDSEIEITNLSFTLHESSINHGIHMNIKGIKPKNKKIDKWGLKLNFYGGFWDILPKGLDKIIKWYYMPLDLTSYLKALDTAPLNN